MEDDETWSVARKDTLFIWDVDTVEVKLEENGWECEDGFWLSPSGHHAKCFKDRLLREHPNWVAKWFLELTGVFPGENVDGTPAGNVQEASTG
jgi:hypothetical protein